MVTHVTAATVPILKQISVMAPKTRPVITAACTLRPLLASSEDSGGRLPFAGRRGPGRTGGRRGGRAAAAPVPAAPAAARPVVPAPPVAPTAPVGLSGPPVLV